MTILIKLIKTSIKCLVEMKSKMNHCGCFLSCALGEVKMVCAPSGMIRTIRVRIFPFLSRSPFAL
jgi:hypothetical protein